MVPKHHSFNGEKKAGFISNAGNGLLEILGLNFFYSKETKSLLKCSLSKNTF